MLEPSCSNRQGLAGVFTRSTILPGYREGNFTNYVFLTYTQAIRSPARTGGGPSTEGGDRDASQQKSGQQKSGQQKSGQQKSSQQESRDHQRRGPPGRGVTGHGIQGAQRPRRPVAAHHRAH